jgi:hypothetical protein
MVLPKLYTIGKYVIFFWSNENNEPVHVHVAVKRMSQYSVKIWLTKDGGCVVAKQDKNIIHPSNLNTLLSAIRANHDEICEQWKNHFGIDDIKFYC